MKKLILAALVLIQIANAQNVPYNIPTNGLVAWYPFTGNALDSSGNANNATFVGTGVTLANDRFSLANSSYSFAGNANDYIRVPSDNFPSGDRTISLWFNVPTVANRPMLLGYGGGGFLGYGTSFLMGLNVMGGGSYHCQGHYLSNAIDYVYPADPINAWNHYVVTVNGNELRIYVNGVMTASNTAFTYTTIVAGRDLVFGVMPSATGYAPYTDVNGGYLQGRLDDIGVWNRALSAAEISSIYNNCGVLFSSQPVNQTKNVGANAQFVVATSYTNATYQWQTSSGSGYTSLTNTGQYSGVTTATLQVSNVSNANYGQMFRCAINNGTCSDTSSAAVLYVTNPSGIKELDKEVIKVYPNPFTDQINIFIGTNPINEIKVFDILGNQVESQIQNKSTESIQLTIPEASEGIYFVKIKSAENTIVLKVLRN